MPNPTGPVIPDPPSGNCAEGDLILLVGVCDGGDPPNYVLGWVSGDSLGIGGGGPPEGGGGQVETLEQLRSRARAARPRD